jgi:hypothetical protein
VEKSLRAPTISCFPLSYTGDSIVERNRESR